MTPRQFARHYMPRRRDIQYGFGVAILFAWLAVLVWIGMSW